MEGGGGDGAADQEPEDYDSLPGHPLASSREGGGERGDERRGR
ncbi:MAG: hypothetical protein ABJA82_03405 [Myxococcales bacterium]